MKQPIPRPPRFPRFDTTHGITRFAGHLLATAAVAVLCACKSVPDASQFAAAGSQLHSAVVSAGNVVSDELRQAQLSDSARALDKQWQVPDECTLAMMRYGNAIAGIVQTSRDSEAAAQQVIDAGAQLATTIGVAVPPLLASAEAGKLIDSIAREIVNARAARSLKEALAAMQPVVDDTALLLSRQLDNANEILLDASLQNRLTLVMQYQNDVRYAQTLASDRQKLYDVPRTADTNRQFDEIVTREKVIAPTVAIFEQRDAERKQRWSTRHALIDAAKQAVLEWAAAHRELLAAVNEGNSVDLKALNESIVELRALIQKARAS